MSNLNAGFEKPASPDVPAGGARCDSQNRQPGCLQPKVSSV
ncbi:hypothetical protein [Runella sp.]